MEIAEQQLHGTASSIKKGHSNEEAETIWGRANRVAMHRLREVKATPPFEENFVNEVVSTLFPDGNGTVITEDPHPISKVYNACLREGVFPAAWKSQRLLLILKPLSKPAAPQYIDDSACWIR